jgi:hypothetical protein
MPWFLLALILPVVVAWNVGSTYVFAWSVAGVGLAMYVGNIGLIYVYIKHRAPSALVDDTWEDTAGKGIVPQWVSVLGLIGTGLILSGLIVAALVFGGYAVTPA